MAVRTVKRRGERRLVIDILYDKPDGTKGRYRHDAEVQNMAAARAEERRRLAALAATGSPYETPVMSERARASEERPTATEAAPKATGKPFAEVAELYLTSFAPSQLKPSTLHGYTKTIRSFLIPRIGTRPVDEIDAGVVRELDAELVRRGVKPATRRQMAIALRSILCRYAVEAKILTRAPDFPSLPKIGGKIMNAMTREDVDRLLAVCGKAHRLAFLLAAFAGLRAGEIRGLRRCDVDLSAGQLVVRESICRGMVAAPKSGHERVVPLVPLLRAAIEELEPAARTAPVALTAKGTRWGEYGLRQAFLRACRRAGLKGWRLHDLRHFFVTQLFRGGTPAPTVQALAGHAHLTTTERYAHVARVDLRAAIERLGG